MNTDLNDERIRIHGEACCYVGQQEWMKEKILPNIVRWQGGSNSTEIWGYYTPCVADRYLWNGVKSGRLIKPEPFDTDKENRFLYGIDADDRLIYIEDRIKNDCSERTYLLYEEDMVLGVTYHDYSPDEVERFVECRFREDRRIVSFMYLYLITMEDAELWLRRYRYDADGCIAEFDHIDGSRALSLCHKESEKFSWRRIKAFFHHDEERRFTGWHKVEYYDDEQEDADYEAAVLATEPYTIKYDRADRLPTMMTIGKRRKV